jgi:phage terminase large subunit-like protein
VLRRLTPTEAAALEWDWWWWGRPDQFLPPGAWRTWLILTGRGWGKTRTGAEAMRQWARDYSHLALIGRTPADVRDVMVEGPTGILSVSPKWERPDYQPSRTRLVWPNGSVAHTYSAQEPDALRGPQHTKLWGDEVASWPSPMAWDNAMLGLRLGDNPQAIATTTPKPKALIRRLLKDPRTIATRGSTYDNAENLATAFLDDMRAAYEGTTIGQQELYAAILDEAPGALWKRATIQDHRISLEALDAVWDRLGRVVVAVDPAVTGTEGSDETGVVVVGADTQRWQLRQGYVLDDLSLRASPDNWAEQVAQAARNWDADEVVAEANNGGELVRLVLKTKAPDLRVVLVHASQGKQARAEPVSALYEQGRIHHLNVLEALEDQLCTWVPGEKGQPSPDRLDALVWGLTHTMLGRNRLMQTST